MDERERKELLNEFDRFAGGRSLTAIYECEDLSDKEQAILLYFGHCAEFQKNGFVKHKCHRLETIAKKVRVSVDTARRTIKLLMDRGYISRVRRLAQNGLELTPEYSLTWKIFQEYEAKWLIKAIENKNINDFGDSNLLGEGSNLLGEGSNLLGVGLHRATPIIDPSSSCPSSVNVPLSSSSGGGGKQKKAPPPKVSEEGVHIGIVRSMDWLFSKTRKGGYEYQVANNWMEKLVRDRGEQACWEMSEWFAERAMKHRETARGTWVVSPAALIMIIGFYDTERKREAHEEANRQRWEAESMSN